MLVEFERGAAAAGNEIEFHVTNSADMPPVPVEVELWSGDPELEAWLKKENIPFKRGISGAASSRSVILVSTAPPGEHSAQAWRELALTIARGSTAIFLDPAVFAKADQPLGWLPLKNKGSVERVSEYTFPQLYPKDEWVKNHPIFDGLPAGGLMDVTFYRDIMADYRFSGQDTPQEAIAGAFRTSNGYKSELMLAVYKLGAGRFILNSLRIRQELGRDPSAERLLRNMILYAAEDIGKPPVEVSKEMEAQLVEVGL
jgi:hypothetical protein